MMFALKRVFILFVIVVAGYCFWPRAASLAKFEPKRMSELQMTVWKKEASKKPQGLLVTFYEIYERQYKLPPVAALKMAYDTQRAVTLFASAPDAADQEKALQPLQTVFVTLRSNTKSSFDSDAAARMELTTWMLRADHAKRGQLTSAWSELLGILYGHPAPDCLPAAKKFAIAAKLAEEGKWAEAGASALEAWTAVKELAVGSKTKG